MQVLPNRLFQICVGSLLIVGWVAGFAQASPTLDIASSPGSSTAPGSTINFNGAGTNTTFAFSPAPDGSDFTVISEQGGTGAAINLTGLISGTYTIGAITTIGSLQTATVTGTGQLSIGTAATGGVLTANLNWVDIFQAGTSGDLNVGGVLNLSNVSYTGSNADLQALALESVGSATLDFTFNPALSLAQLTANGASNSTSYSGTIYTVPAPPTFSLLLCAGFVGIGCQSWGAMRRWRSSAQVLVQEATPA